MPVLLLRTDARGGYRGCRLRALGLASRAFTTVVRDEKRSLGPLLASALLDPKCEGGAALPEKRKAELREIAPPKKAPDKR